MQHHALALPQRQRIERATKIDLLLRLDSVGRPRNSRRADLGCASR
jgi:hypothetical protein